MQKLKSGDHLKVNRLKGAYTHHGIYIGKDRVIHYSGDLTHKRGASIRATTLKDFAAGNDIRVVKYGKAYTPRAVVNRAKRRLGENGYGLFGNNCEHFARWCKTGHHRSEQVRKKKVQTAGAVATQGSRMVAFTTITSAGSLAGASAPSLMTGLATVGKLVGAGAVGGIAIAGAVPAAVTAASINRTLSDDKNLTKRERKARAAGRKASVAGAVLGTGGTVAAVSAAGTTGLSAVGITSGLKAIGIAVGGGMSAGVAVTTALPAAVAFLLGMGAYKLLKSA
jgi:hypothetical protein